MTSTNIFANRFDENFSYLVSFPTTTLKLVHGDKIEYLSLVVNNAYNAGISLQNIIPILFLINNQVTQLPFNEKLMEQITFVMSKHYAKQEASNDND